MDSRRRDHSTGNLFDPFHPSRRCDVDRLPGRLTNLVRFYTTIIFSFSFVYLFFFFVFISSREYFVVDFVTLLRPPLVVGRNYPPRLLHDYYTSLSSPDFSLYFFFLFCSLYTRIIVHVHTRHTNARTHRGTRVYFL